MKHDLNFTAKDVDVYPVELAHLRRTNLLYKRVFLIIFAIIIVVGGSLIAIWAIHAAPNNKVSDPVPSDISHKIAFNIYFPDQAKLPAGYTLDTSSFSITKHILIYTVSFGNNQQLFFSVQPKPSANAIQSFYKTRMPITISVATDIGTAAIGVLNNETVGSLPTNTNAWVLVTAPLQVNQSQFKQVLRAMTLAQ